MDGASQNETVAEKSPVLGDILQAMNLGPREDTPDSDRTLKQKRKDDNSALHG